MVKHEFRSNIVLMLLCHVGEQVAAMYVKDALAGRECVPCIRDKTTLNALKVPTFRECAASETKVGCRQITLRRHQSALSSTPPGN